MADKIARLERSEFELRREIGTLCKKVREADDLLRQGHFDTLTRRDVQAWLKEGGK
jgi:hypothetical protein